MKQILCKSVTVLVQFFFSGTFCWMLIEGGLLFQRARMVSKQQPKILILMLIGWGKFKFLSEINNINKSQPELQRWQQKQIYAQTTVTCGPFQRAAYNEQFAEHKYCAYKKRLPADWIACHRLECHLGFFKIDWLIDVFLFLDNQQVFHFWSRWYPLQLVLKIMDVNRE